MTIGTLAQLDKAFIAGLPCLVSTLGVDMVNVSTVFLEAQGAHEPIEFVTITAKRPVFLGLTDAVPADRPATEEEARLIDSVDSKSDNTIRAAFAAPGSHLRFENDYAEQGQSCRITIGQGNAFTKAELLALKSQQDGPLDADLIDQALAHFEILESVQGDYVSYYQYLATSPEPNTPGNTPAVLSADMFDAS